MGRGKRVESVLSSMPEPSATQAVVRVIGLPGDGSATLTIASHVVGSPSDFAFVLPLPALLDESELAHDRAVRVPRQAEARRRTG